MNMELINFASSGLKFTATIMKAEIGFILVTETGTRFGTAPKAKVYALGTLPAVSQTIQAAKGEFICDVEKVLLEESGRSRMNPQQNLLKAGDMVILISGGPIMTVKAVHQEEHHQVDCWWFRGESELCTASFPFEVLRYPQPSDARFSP